MVFVLKIRNRRLSCIIKTKGHVCACTRARNSTHSNSLERVWTNESERKRVCVGEGGGELAWWRGNVCERNAAKKSGHVCRQQINENKVASSSYSGAPAERSASIYTTQGSDLIWETDLHPRWHGRGKENDAKEEEEGRKERRCWEWRQPRSNGREGQDGRATEERGYTGVYSRIHSPVRLFPSAERPNRMESNQPADNED